MLVCFPVTFLTDRLEHKAVDSNPTIEEGIEETPDNNSMSEMDFTEKSIDRGENPQDEFTQADEPSVTIEEAELAVEVADEDGDYPRHHALPDSYTDLDSEEREVSRELASAERVVSRK
jgi:hypothetical protein